MGAFKSYDIRGVYGEDVTEDLAYKIGRCLPSLLNANAVLIGRDGRLSSPMLFDALTNGVMDAGVNVFDAGLCTTPMVYYITAKYGFNASIQITASHNSKQYNGFKISRTGVRPVGYDTGLKELEQMVLNGNFDIAHERGKIIPFDKRVEYIDFQKSALSDISELNLAIDCSNGMSALLAEDIFGNLPTYINATIDGNFPAHEPNPLVVENTSQLSEVVRKKSCDLGIIFDGDADRVAFIDENGDFISPDLITAVLAGYYLKERKGWILHDIRTSRSVPKYVEKMGGNPYIWKVGHAYAKEKMRELDAIVGGELAGHYYFKDFFYCDSAILAVVIVLKMLLEAKKNGGSMSQIIADINLYAYSGEYNFVIKDKAEAINQVVKWAFDTCKPVKVHDFDGYRIEYNDWWFSLRSSNTENYVRLVCEADNKQLLDEKLGELRSILREYSDNRKF